MTRQGERTKRLRGVPPHPEALSPRAARAQLEDVFGARLRGWILRADVSFTDVSEALALARPKLYEVFEGTRRFQASWLALLPPAVLRCALEDLADVIHCELRPQEQIDESRDEGRELVHEALDVIRRVTDTSADGVIDRREASEELRDLDELEALIALRRARLRRAMDDGAAVLPIARRADR